MHPRIRLRFAQCREAVLELHHQRADQLRGIVPVVLAAADEVMRHRGAALLAARQPRRQDRALAHPRTAGDHDPVVAIAVDQQLIKAGQQLRAADELLVSLPLAAVVEPLPWHPTEHHSRKRRAVAVLRPCGPCRCCVLAVRDVKQPRLWACEQTRYHGAVGGRSVRGLHISDLYMRSVDGPQAARARLEAASRWRVLGRSGRPTSPRSVGTARRWI